jgi:hypothetical protein
MSGQACCKMERSHGTDQREFYQLLTYKDDIDLNARLAEWEAFYNYHRPQRSLVISHFFRMDKPAGNAERLSSDPG